MEPVTEFPLLDEILEPHRQVLGPDYEGYRNHCARMLNFCFALAELDEEQKKKCTIASAFHDLGIWLEDTVDYIGPSIPPAVAYLRAHGLEAWEEEVTLMITEHHKIRPYEDRYRDLVEVFRKADLVDFSLGVAKSGLSSEFVAKVKTEFPNAGFHGMLARRASRWLLRNPLNPAPMMKW